MLPQIGDEVIITATVLVSDIRSKTGEDLSFFPRSPQDERRLGPISLELWPSWQENRLQRAM